MSTPVNYPGTTGVTPAGSNGGINPDLNGTGVGNLNMSTTNNPQLMQQYNRMNQWGNQVWNNEDPAAKQAMMRQRDTISGLMNEFGGVAASRGIFGSGAQLAGMSSILNKGQRELAGTNVGLASDARKQALGYGMAGIQAAGQIANNQIQQQGNNINAFNALSGANHAANQDALAMAEFDANMQNQLIAAAMNTGGAGGAAIQVPSSGGYGGYGPSVA